MGERMVQLIDVTKKYRGVAALENCNLNLEKGKIYGLVGKNGAGKTTMMRMITGMEDFCPISPAYMAMFPPDTIAVEVHAVLYGLIGVAFSGMMFIYEQNQIGFVIQNIIYILGTGIVWVPIATIIWQLYLYPSALIGTIGGFVVTYVIMSVVGYRTTKKEVEEINQFLEQKV